jgi:restriction system protein
MKLLRNSVRTMSMLFNWFRLRGQPEHQRCVRQARRSLHTLRNMQGAAAEARLFSYCRKVDPLVFEELVLCAFEVTGAFIVRNLRYSGDGGIDGRAWIPGSGWCAIQVKRYSGHICHDHVAIFGATLTRSRCELGFFVHCGRTGSAAFGHLADRRIVLVSGQRLVALICSGQLPPATMPSRAESIPKP